LFPLGPQPDIVGPDFRAVARQIVNAEVALDGSSRRISDLSGHAFSQLGARPAAIQ
jgi:hypothetical protein